MTSNPKLSAPRRRPAEVNENASEDATGSGFKRRRTALACNSCRFRKSRCDGARPLCSVCMEMGFECVYRRPVPASSQAQSVDPVNSTRIEERLQAVEQMLSAFMDRTNRLLEIETGATESEPWQMATPSRTTYSQTGSRGIGPLDPVDETELQGNEARTPRSNEDTVDGMGIITFADEQMTGFFGPSSNSALFRHIVNAMAPNSDNDPRAPQDVTYSGNASILTRPSSPFRDISEAGRTERIDRYKLPPEAQVLKLIRLFFSHTGMMFPYLYERSILTNYAEMNKENLRKVRRSSLCILNVIMAFATCVSDNLDRPVEDRAADAEVFFQRALALSHNMSFMPANLEILQAFLLITQYLQGTRRSSQTCSLHGITIQVAMQIGVHASQASSRCTRLEKELRNRSWYNCVILDRMLSMTLGRPPLIPMEYVQTELPLDVDLRYLDDSIESGIENEEPPRNSTVCFFIATIKLYEILGDVIKNLYGQNINTSASISASQLLGTTIKYEQRLAVWKQELPAILKIKSHAELAQNMNELSSFERLSSIITIRYLNSRILLHRQVLVRFLDHVREDTRDASDDWHSLNHFGQSSLQIAVESASELILIVHWVGGRRDLLPAWWYAVYYAFNAALIVFAALVIRSKLELQTMPFSVDALAGSLELALEALTQLGGEVHLVKRCKKVLKKLIQISTPLKNAVLFPFHAVSNNPNFQNSTYYAPAIALQDDGNRPPLMIEDFFLDGDLLFQGNFI